MNNARVVAGNLIWRFLERCGAQGVTFFVSIILARLLDPEAYGTIALVTAFTSILQVFVDSGLGTALIQKENADDLDFSSVFYCNVIVCSLLYLGMFFLAPTIAFFYDNEELISIIRVISLIIIISGVKNIQQAYVSRNFLFKKFFFSTLGGTVVAAVAGVLLAYKGYGVWALVWQLVLNNAVDTLVLWITVPWRPVKQFSFDRLKVLFIYGWKLLVSSLMDALYTDVRQLIIGKMYSSSDLAQYNRGRTFPYLIVVNVNSSIDSVLFPLMASEQLCKEKIREIARKSIIISTYIIAPVMIGLITISKPLVRLLLTEKWIPCVPFMVIFCITFMIYPIHTANLNAIKAMGRSDLFLKLEMIKKSVGLLSLFITMWFGVLPMAYSLLFTSLCSQVINSYPNKRLLDYGFMDQIKDVLPIIGLSVLMGVIIWPIQYFGMADLVTVFLQVFAGVLVYFICSRVFNIYPYVYLLETIKRYSTKQKNRSMK